MEHIATISSKGVKLIASFEGVKLNAYLDTGGVWTIGVGTTRYPATGERVRKGDYCSKEEALTWFAHDLAGTCKDVDDLTRDDITQNQFDALVSLVYNIGRRQFSGSTVRRLVNANPVDPKIAEAFKMWCKDNGKFIQGLLNRRADEAQLYFS